MLASRNARGAFSITPPLQNVAHAQHFRNAIKHVAERFLVGAAGLTRLGRGLRGDTILLAYHNIVPKGTVVQGEASLHLKQETFGRQLDALRATHDVISLMDAPFAAARRGSRPRAVITFDDAYHGALTAGLAELEERGMPATYFVAPGFIPNGSFWWDALADEQGHLDDELRAKALAELAGSDQRVRAWAAAQGHAERALPLHATAAAYAVLEAAARVPGVSFGSHTWSHCNLTAVSTETAERELSDSDRWLRERFDCTIPWISYPYGLADPGTELLARDLGYSGGLRIDGGWLRGGGRGSRYGVPRLNVASGLSPAGFRLRADGLFWR